MNTSPPPRSGHDKVVASAAEAVADVQHGASLAVGGFGLVGIPWTLISALLDQGADDLTVVSNNCGVDGAGLGLLLEARRITRVIASYVGENKEFARQYLAGELTVELTPQGTLAERLRAGGSGIPAFYTRTGVGTLVADGKPHADFDGTTYVQERAIVADVSLVRAHRADTAGNLTYRYTARNFNPVVATAGRLTIAEAEHIVLAGELDPNHVVTPGVYVQRLVPATAREKPIEQRTVRQRDAVTEGAFR
jgi:3-oxoacid CoA-transferase subunit A